MFKNPFSFNGRIRRTEYVISFLMYFIARIFLYLHDKPEDGNISIFTFLCYILLAWFMWAQGAKRCHDLGKTGWFQIIPFYIFVMLFREGDLSFNKYGADTKRRVNSSDLILPE